MGLSNNIITVLNFIALLCSIPIIASGIWLSSKPDSECVRLIRWPVIILGVLILLVSLAGFAGAYWKHQCLLASFLLLMAILIVLLLALLVFAFVVTQSGCCKPPSACGYGYVNPTVWVSPTSPSADPDCYAWSNDQGQLCYSCSSCKAGLIGNLRGEWRKANAALIAATVALIFIYIIGCSALKNVQTEELFRRHRQGFAKN
ncbi:Tetraspanin-2 [Platanthera guangdongensis]|uniref:Tetraspanin-2 n=1 Tax=Platanthera guangdongensis TaxID=2320717 RepID=A0ABR2N1H1_9ASPA